MKLKKITNAFLVVLTLALVAAASVAITWALSHATATQKDNTFTTPNISLDLIEETWDGDTDGDGNKNTTSDALGITEFGEVQANGYTSGSVINKDPKLHNSSKYGEYVALKLEYYVYEGNTAVLVDASSFKTNVATFTVNKTDWTADTTWNGTNTGKELYYYRDASGFKNLAADSDTSDIFQTVTVRAGDSGSVTKAAGGTLTWSEMPKFEIKVIGYAVQSDNLDKSTDATTIEAQIKGLIK